MNEKDLFNAIGNIDDKYISEFADTSKFKKKIPFFLSPKFYTGIAAVFVIGMAVFIAMQRNPAPIDIQNDSVHNDTAVSETKQNDNISPTVPYSNKNADTNNTDKNSYNDVPDTFENHAYADEPYHQSEQVHDVLFSIKVYAAEIPEDLSKNGAVKIKGDFNPLMSSSMGIGIEFEIEFEAANHNPITLQAESGYFVTWDKDSGIITEHGSSFTVSETTDFFWTFDGKTNDTFIKVTDGNSVLSTIKISYDESTNTFYAQNT